jgi:hypothetical protein
MENGEKRKVLDEIFQNLRQKNPKSSVLKFDNDLVKKISASKFRNQFDVTKCDTPKLLPRSIVNAGFFIVHLGGGEHAFVKGEGYHNFENIKEIKKWKVKKSVIDDISESEAQSASTAFSNKIIHDFLFGRTDIDLLLHTARRARVSYNFKVNNEPLKAEALQIEFDGIYESASNETIATIEVKNKDNSSFEVRQLFSAMKYCEQKIPKNYKIRLLFLVRIRNEKEDSFNLYEYKFKNKEELTSIEFVRARSYQIEKN